jgi:hypothetical protein
MSVETKMVREVSPLAPGRYWLFLNSPVDVRDFDQWVKDMAGAVRVESSTGDPRSLFVIFVVPPNRAPFLNAAQFGFPNTAPPEVTGPQDVVQAPIVKDISDVDPFAFGVPTVPILLLLAFLAIGSGGLSGFNVFRTSSARKRRQYA